ncbi:MAG: hypothetical protein NTU53_17735 [Planctomycetota bacterium]|nr:hypothetical protein [Planctomycetota bacterium]
MKMLRRLGAAFLLAAFLAVSSGLAQAQVLKHVRDDALAVIKMNNAQAVSDKAATMAKKMGLANLNVGFGDPLTLLKEKLNLKAGVDFTGEAAVVIFRPPAGEREPRALALIPVSDYKAFLGNFANVKKEGDADTFSIQPDGEPVYSEQWGKYAAVSPWKDLLLEQPSGLKVGSIVEKQFAEKDLTVYVNMKVVREMILPQFQQIKAMIGNMPMGQPGQPPGQEAFQRAMAVQIFDGVEAFLTQSQSAALSVNLATGGIAYTLSVDFMADSSMGKALAAVPNTDANLITSLPKEKYLLFGGWVQDGKGMWEFVKAVYDKPIKAATLAPADAKAVDDAMAAMEKMLTSVKSGEFGMIAPPQGAGLTAGVIHGVFVMTGDAKAILESQKKYMDGQAAFMKATGNQGVDLKVTSQTAAKTIDGVAMDKYDLAFTVDPKSPQAAVVGQVLKVFYGESVTSYVGALNDKTIVSGINIDEAQLQAAVASTKQAQAQLAASDAVKAASEQLPKKRIAVAYIALDNILTVAFEIAAQMGQAAPLKVPTDLPPIGVSVGTEGTALRIDANLPATLIENMVSMGIQAAMQAGQRRAPAAAP